MTMSFPLLKLPLIPLELIIEQLDSLDLVQLSMYSTKFRDILELLKLSVQTLHVFITEISYGISILRNSNSSYIDVCDSVPVGTSSELANIQGEPVHIWSQGRDEVKVKSALSKLATLETIIKYTLSITKVAKYSLTYNDVEMEIRSLFIWQLTTQLYQFKSYLINGGLVQISSEDLTFLLEGVSVECLCLNVDCPGFKYQKPIRHPRIHIRYPCWIDFDQFSLGPETIEASFSGQKVSVDVLNRLIKDWTEGKNPKLRDVKFTWTDNGPAQAMAREHEARPPRTILPNRNVEQLKGLCINYSISNDLWNHSVYNTVKLSVEEDFGLNGIHLDDQV